MNLKSDFLSLLGLCTFVIAHPVLAVLGDGSTFFIAHGMEAADILIFALVIFILPAIFLIAPAACLQFASNIAAKLFISVVVGVLAGLWVISIAPALPATFSIAIALVFGAFIGSCYSAFPRLRDFMQILGLLSPVVIVFFIGFTPVKSLLFFDEDFGADPIAARKTPIVMLLFDELSLAAIITPDGEIDAQRLPNFSRLEGISTWYRNTTTVSTHTEKSVPAILSGMRPRANTQPTYRSFPRNLFTLLAASHTINASETITRLCPKEICSKIGSGASNQFGGVAIYRDVWFVWLHSILPEDLAAQHLPSISDRWSNFSREVDRASEKNLPNIVNLRFFDMNRNESLRFGNFVASIRDDSGPTLNYLHLALPHVPWIYLPDGVLYNGNFIAGRTSRGYGWVDDQYLADKGVLRYSLQVEYVDSLLGQALDALEESGRLAEVMLIVVSDHGVAFAPGKPGRTPKESTLASVSRVPLFIKYPGQLSGKREERKIETIDIFPTAADVLGVPLSGEVDGQSLISDNWHPVARHVLEAGSNFDNVEHEMDVRIASERIYRVLKPGKSALDAIGLGSGKEYIGKKAPAPTGLETRFTLQLDNPRWYEEVDLSTNFLPARMTGTLKGASLGTDIMVALNGTVSGSGVTYDKSGSVSIMLDPRQFRSGKNELRAYVIVASKFFEIPVASDFDGWSITRNDVGIATVTDHQGNSYQQDETLKGRAAFNAFRASIEGYACDETHQLSPKALLLVEDNAVINTGFTMTTDTLFSNGQENTMLECWFSLEVNPDLRGGDGSLSIMALFEGGRLMEIYPKK